MTNTGLDGEVVEGVEQQRKGEDEKGSGVLARLKELYLRER